MQIKTDHAPIRLQKAIERIGAVKEGILHNHMIRKDGTTRHTVMYSVINRRLAGNEGAFQATFEIMIYVGK